MPAQTPPPPRPIPATEWQKAAGDLDYSKDVPEPPKPPKDATNLPNWNLDTEAWGQVFQLLAVILAIAGLAWAVYRMMQQPRNRAVSRDGVEITLDNLEEYLHESDLDRFLRQALAAGNYPLAVRLYYLQTIKHLSERGHLKWARDKTNRDYLNEMRRHPQSDDFRRATRTYERIWYGNAPLDAEGFRRVEPEFKKVIEKAI